MIDFVVLYFVCIFDGCCIVEDLFDSLKVCVDVCVVVGGSCLGLVVVLVGGDLVLIVYVCNKCCVVEKVGIEVYDYDLLVGIIEVELFDLIDQFNVDLKINGILIQLFLLGIFDVC